ncbi:MAG: serine/threonine-protein phosphatase [Planctomycetes bacterium]|nr:serine/threonine-protein phosphatase [Planctomycetota bacterium]
MDEPVEEKLAQHFVRGCTGWNYFNAEPEPIERLRHRARFLVFKLRILRWVREDRRYRFAGGGRWLCPYCLDNAAVNVPDGVLEDPDGWGESPEEAPFLEEIVGHLLSCEDFQAGEDRLRSIQDLEEAKTRGARRRGLESLRKRFRTERSYQLVDQSRRWLCPFCATAQEFRLEGKPGDDFYVLMGKHLSACKARQVLGDRPRPVEELKDQIRAGAKARQLDKVRRKVSRHAMWRVRDLEGRWYCPYCTRQTLVQYPSRRDSSGELDRFLGGVLEHLAACDDYRRPNKAVRKRAEMAAAVEEANLTITRVRRVRRLLSEDPLFGVTDRSHDWLCPYCQRVQRHIHLDIAEESATFEKTVEIVASHLYQECDAASDDPPTLGLTSLKDLARPRQVEVLTRAEPIAARTDPLEESQWARIKRDLDVLKSRAAKRESSLQEARSKQLRLLSDMPEIPGYSFGRVYTPCDAVGGDFFNVFRVDEGVWGFSIGDISGHGIEAALLMGLAKKLIEVHGRGMSSPAQVLSLANQDIYNDLDERTFVTAFYGVLEAERRVFRIARAGHDPVVLFNPRRNPRLQVIEQKGMALGMDEGPLFERAIEELEVTLLPGDLVFQYTDGVTETMNVESEQFGNERLNAVIEAYGQHEVEYLLWKIERALREFRGEREQEDDVTMVAFQVLET